MTKTTIKKKCSDHRWNTCLQSNFKRIDSKVSHVEPWAIKAWHKLKEDAKRDRVVNENNNELRNEMAVDNLPGVEKELGEYFESDVAVKNEKAEDHFKNISKVKTEVDIKEQSFKKEPVKEDTNLDVKEEKLEIKVEPLGLSDVKMEPIDRECYSKLKTHQKIMKNHALTVKLEKERYLHDVKQDPAEYFENAAAVKNEIAEDHLQNISKVKTEFDAKKPSIKGVNYLDIKEERLKIKEETLVLSDSKMESIDGERYSKLKNLALVNLEEEKYFDVYLEQHGQNQSTSKAQRQKGL